MFALRLSQAGSMLCEDPRALMDIFERTCTIACNCARIGNFRMECQYRWNQALQGATAHLGTAKQWTKMAAESFLCSVQNQHQQLLAKPRPAKSRWAGDWWMDQGPTVDQFHHHRASQSISVIACVLSPWTNAILGLFQLHC